MLRKILVALMLLALLVPASDAEAKKKKRRAGKSKPVAAMTKDGLPNVQAAGAIVMDLDSGAALYAKHPDDLRAIASTSKIFVAMVVRRKGIDLDAETVIIEDDQKRARGGAKSRLLVGRRFKNKDLLGAMLIASDNRACTALGRAVGLTPEQLIAEMNGQAKRLGLKKTVFSDPSGLRGNESTPREMALALREALGDPLLADLMMARQLEVRAADGGEPLASGKKGHKKPYAVHYNNTNVSLRTSRFTVVGGKTGYTDKARYCLVIAAKIGGKSYAMVFLGAEGELTRFADFERVADWIDSGKHAGKAARTAGVGALADPPPGPVSARLAP